MATWQPGPCCSACTMGARGTASLRDPKGGRATPMRMGQLRAWLCVATAPHQPGWPNGPGPVMGTHPGWAFAGCRADRSPDIPVATRPVWPCAWLWYTYIPHPSCLARGWLTPRRCISGLPYSSVAAASAAAPLGRAQPDCQRTTTGGTRVRYGAGLIREFKNQRIESQIPW